MNRIAWALLLCLAPLALQAQEQRPLTNEAAAAMAAFHNRPGTIRLSGPTRLPAGTELAGDVSTLGGPLEVEGLVRGDVLVINGDLRLLPGGRITGAVTVVGGAVMGPLDGVSGDVVVYPEALRFRRENGRIVALEPEAGSVLTAGWRVGDARVDLNLGVDGSYNRVEGLPISFGPRVEVGRSNPTILEARVIYRTRSGLRIHPDELGHDVRLEQYLFGHRAFRVGVGRHRTADPIELNGLSDTENSLSTFILHRDYRDHYVRRGWRAWLAYDGRTRPIDLGLEYRDESHGSVQPRTPWSLLDNDEPWRTQPQVAEGELRTLRGWLAWDTRNNQDDPATGWLIRAEAEQGLEGDLRLMEPTGVILPGGRPELTTRPVGAEFTTVRIDARRYLRVGPRTRLALRAVAAGSPDDGALPPQRQHVLGGEGSLPGYERLVFDCGAREAPTLAGYLPHYGCDRSVLLQAEGRFSLFSGGFSLGRRLGLDFDLVTTPELVAFVDAGRAWIEAESLAGRQPGTTAFRYDAGLGLRLGRLGVYLAVPLNEADDGAGAAEGLNFFVRVGPRF